MSAFLSWTNFSTFSPRVISCTYYLVINNHKQQRISELTTEMGLLQNSSSECIWTSASSKRSECNETQPILKCFFFSWLHGFHSFSVIQISSHLVYLHLLLWQTILNWSRGWEEHPASIEKRSGGLEAELVVPLFLAGRRGTVHATAPPSFSWRQETSSPLPHFCNCWHPLRVQRATFLSLNRSAFQNFGCKTQEPKELVYSMTLLLYFFFSSLTYANPLIISMLF